MTNEHLPFGVDTGSHCVLNKSRPDLEMDHDILAAWDMEPKFNLIRATRCRPDWTDLSYKLMRSESERVGLIVGTWHVLSPYYPTAPQVERWLEHAPEPGPMGRWIDWERVGRWVGQERVEYRAASPYQLRRSAEMIEDHDNRPAGIYCNSRKVNDFLGSISTTQLNSWYYWHPQYLYFQNIRGEYPSDRMSLPKRVDRERIVLHQTADKLPPPKGCLPHKKGLDYNRWVGVMSIAEFIGNGPAPLPEFSPEEKLELLWRDHKELHYG